MSSWTSPGSGDRSGLDRFVARQSVDHRVAGDPSEEKAENTGNDEAKADRAQRLPTARPGEVDRKSIEEHRQEEFDSIKRKALA